jgi:hypothetical protein
VTTQNNVAAEMTQGVDSDSDGVEQHRDGELQGRGADPEGHAPDHIANTVIMLSGRERDA